jgi:hypothetical protein
VKAFKLGQQVYCPPDRGEAGYRGTVTYVSPVECTNHQGIPYQWVHVRKQPGVEHVWPSIRLS